MAGPSSKAGSTPRAAVTRARLRPAIEPPIQPSVSQSSIGQDAARDPAASVPAPQRTIGERGGRESRGESAIWIGCSGWAYPSWRPDFYPEKTPQKKLLEAYAARLNSVEVNYTFRSLPTASVVESWLNAIPAEFRFSFKAPQRITHFQRLRGTAETLAALARAVQPVRAAGRIGLILFQLPPNFSSDPVLLDEFLAEAADSLAGLRPAFEFRHASWFTDAVYAVLERHAAALCVASSDDLATPDVVTAPFTCYRLRRSQYTAADLDAVRETLLSRAMQGEVFAYFKHEEEPSGPLRAAAVLEGLRA